MEKQLYISVIIPVKSFSRYLFYEGIPAFKKQTYQKFEVIVVCDKCFSFKELEKKYAWLKIFKHEGSPSEKRNYGVSKSKGQVLAFIDDDAYPSKNWLKKLNLEFSKRKFSVFCGPGVLPKNSSFVEKIFDKILISKLGSGKFTYRFQNENTRFVDDYPLMNFAILKNLFVDLGGFDNFWPGEDSKFCDKIVKHSYQILYLSDLVVFHHRKKNLFAFLSQHKRYGHMRGLFFATGDNNSKKIIYVLPSLFLLYIAFAVYFSIFFRNIFILFPFFLYLFLVLFFAIFNFFKNKDFSFLFFLFVSFVLMHFVYSLSFILGFVKGVLKKIFQF